MKSILFLFLFPLAVFAQTDSTEIKLQQYKDLFVKGLINSAEYEALKAKQLGIRQPAEQQAKAANPFLDSVYTQKYIARYKSSIAGGASFIVVGGGMCIGAGLMYNFYKIPPATITNRGVDNTAAQNAIRQRNNGVTVLAIVGGVSTVAGGIILSMGLRNKLVYKDYKTSIALNVGANNVGLCLNF